MRLMFVLLGGGCTLLGGPGEGLIGDFRATLELGGTCGETVRAGADVIGFDNGSASITFYTPDRDRDSNCKPGFGWDWAAEKGQLDGFSANDCLFGADLFLDGGTFTSDGSGWVAEGTGGVEEIGVAELCRGPYELVFDPR